MTDYSSKIVWDLHNYLSLNEDKKYISNYNCVGYQVNYQDRTRFKLSFKKIIDKE